MNDFSSSRVIANFCLGPGFFDGGGGNRTDSVVGTLIDGRALSLSSLRNSSLSMFLDRGIHPSIPICIVKMIDEDGFGDICFRNIYFWDE